MSKVKFFTRFDPPVSTGVSAHGGRTQQHFKAECDINSVLRKYRLGIPAPSSAPVYADLTLLPVDLADAFDKVQEAVDWFGALPSDVRRTFNNDPRNALRLIHSNPQAAVAAGLLPPPGSSNAKPIIDKAAEAAKPEPPEEAAKPPESAA